VADFSLCVCGNKLHTSVFERGFERFGVARISKFWSLLVCVLSHFSLLLIPFGVLLFAGVRVRVTTTFAFVCVGVSVCVRIFFECQICFSVVLIAEWKRGKK
jgi:hypothetical protein